MICATLLPKFQYMLKICLRPAVVGHFFQFVMIKAAVMIIPNFKISCCCRWQEKQNGGQFPLASCPNVCAVLNPDIFQPFSSYSQAIFLMSRLCLEESHCPDILINRQLELSANVCNLCVSQSLSGGVNVLIPVILQ